MIPYNKDSGGALTAGAELLASPRLLYWLLGALVALCATGTLIPQGESLAVYTGRFGAWTGLLLRLRLTDVYHSGPFTALLGALGLNLALCTWRRQIHMRLRPDVLLTHLAILAVLAGGMVSALRGRHGSLPLNAGRATDWAEGTRRFRLPFAVRLEDFHIDLYDSGRHRLTVTSRQEGWNETAEVRPGQTIAFHAGALKVAALDYYPDFSLGQSGPATRSSEPNNPALRLALTDARGTEKHWAFARFPGFHANPKSRYTITYEMVPGRVKQFRSEVSLIEGGWVSERRSIAVNKPLRWKGFTLYQAGYDPENPNYSNILVSHDPGVPVVYAGFLLLTAGLAWTFLRALRRPLI